MRLTIALCLQVRRYNWQCFGCDQAPSSVCPSVGLSVTPFSLSSCHWIIMKFSVTTNYRFDVHAQGQVQRSKVNVTEVKTQLSCFRTITPVWIDIWRWNHAQSLKWHRGGTLLLHMVICQISRSHGTNKWPIWIPNSRFRTVTPVRIDQWLRNDAHSLKKYGKGMLQFYKVIHQILSSHGTYNPRFWPEFSVSVQ